MLSSVQSNIVDTYIKKGMTQDAEKYLVGEGYKRDFSQREISRRQQRDVSNKIFVGTMEERNAITELANGRRFIVTTDGVNAEDCEGLEFVYTDGCWRNPAGFVE